MEKGGGGVEKGEYLDDFDLRGSRKVHHLIAVVAT